MCGFLVYATKGDNSKIRLRGPDCTNVVTLGGLTFVHNLLHVTGSFTFAAVRRRRRGLRLQRRNLQSLLSSIDGEVIIPLYRKHRVQFARSTLRANSPSPCTTSRSPLRGLATDPFKTKPFFINGIDCSSYRSGCLEGTPPQEFKRNRRHWSGRHGAAARATPSMGPYAVEGQLRRLDPRFRRCRQEAGNGQLFHRAVEAGTTAAASLCALLKLGIDFKAYTYVGDENTGRPREPPTADTLRGNQAGLDPSGVASGQHRQRPLHDHLSGPGRQQERVLDDGAALGVATLCETGASRGQEGPAVRPGRRRSDERLLAVAGPVRSSRAILS